MKEEEEVAKTGQKARDRDRRGIRLRFGDFSRKESERREGGAALHPFSLHTEDPRTEPRSRPLVQGWRVGQGPAGLALCVCAA